MTRSGETHSSHPSTGSVEFIILEASSSDATADASTQVEHGTQGALLPGKRGHGIAEAPENAACKKAEHPAKSAGEIGRPMEAQPMDQLLVKLAEQQALLKQQKDCLLLVDRAQVGHPAALDSSSDGSVPMTPATDCFDMPSEGGRDSANPEEAQLDAAEVLRLKQELDAAIDQIARMDQELSQTRITRHTLDQALGPPSEADFDLGHNSTQNTMGMQGPIGFGNRPLANQNQTGPWPVLDEYRPNSGDAVSSGVYPRVQGFWQSPIMPAAAPMTATAPVSGMSSLPSPGVKPGNNPWMPKVESPRPWYHQGFPPPAAPQWQAPNRSAMGFQATPGPSTMNMLNSPFQTPNSNQQARNMGTPDWSHGGSFHQRNDNWPTYPNNDPQSGGGLFPPPFSPQQFAPNSAAMNYQPRPIGTPLSPTAAEFTSNTSKSKSGPWNEMKPNPSNANSFVHSNEPLNYRRLLDRGVSCDWTYIVDKIVMHNDQQASIFLQQKLKIGTVEQKFEIVQAIVAQAYPLMVNRFGNFLVQRCFEHGTPDQVVQIAKAIRGNTLNLSMDAFGCHVVQKAFDSVPEEYKAIMVHELLRRIPETVVHRYACHVWQKLFELRWNDAPPQIMKFVNEALRDMWYEVALGETGSLVVQNIFENCLEEDKRPCIEEVLFHIDVVARGQFGNWCIQHICENGGPADRIRAVNHVLHRAADYSMDQYASKVVEKCLKVGGTDFLDRYLHEICTGPMNRTRLPLIDIASDQYGNYLIQYILTHAGPQHRELVASHVRKHMVSLRGSKFGARVGMLCCNPAIATRPGPAVGTIHPPIRGFDSNRFPRGMGPPNYFK